MLLMILTIIIGLLLLWKGAEFLVAGSVEIAKNLDISPVVIGITVVAFGTSVPELIVAVMAALQGNSGITIGNVIGSNIANIGLVLGFCGLFSSLKVQKHMLNREFPFVLAAPVILFFLSLDGMLTRLDGVILLTVAVIFYLFLIRRVREGKFRRAIEDVAEAALQREKKWITHIFAVMLGLVGVVIGAKLTVDGSVLLGLSIGISELIIGLTVVAVGTSLPEFVTSFIATVKKNDGISLGNIFGSNILNIFVVLGITLIIMPVAISHRVFIFDIPVMLVFSLLLYLSLLEYGKLRRREAIILLGLYGVYIGYSFIR